MSSKSIFIVIPMFKEAKMASEVINDVKAHGYKNIIIVDDGSPDETYKIAKASGVVAIRHGVNRGKGAATQTGLDAAKLLDADIIVTMDGDGQHQAKDLTKLIEPLLNNEVDIVLGSRFLNTKDIPFIKVIANKVANLLTYFFYGIKVSDSQSGLRAYSKKANSLIYTTLDRYEFESEVLQQVRQYKLTYKEVPIEVKYTQYSRTRYNNIKGFPKQDIFNGFRMLYKMFIRALFT